MTTDSGIILLESVQCSHCWQRFGTADVKFIAESPTLAGDPILGPDEALRFAPSRFDPTGAAIDPGGGRCRRLACPRCHSEVPRAALEFPVSPISVIGAPGSGKSTLLAASCWSLRRLAPLIGGSFMDSEPWFNRSLHLDEAALFGTGSAGARLPTKTEISGDRHYRLALIEGREETLPRPMIFTWRIADAARLIALHDNAGEHYLPGADVHARAATRHLARSRALVLALDPLQDRRFARAMKGTPALRDAGEELDPGVHRQDLVVAELAARLREMRGISLAARGSTPIVVAVTKADLWAERLLGEDLQREPIVPPAAPDSAARIDEAMIDSIAERTRSVIRSLLPEIASSLDGLSDRVEYLPHSALGASPLDLAGVARPRWAAIPFLRALAASSAVPA